ncbi:hypothetical protein K435DRAFT_904945, partial [Dendrothele bispora CBS 962.96]
MAYTRSNNSRLDDDACHLTQDYPAFGENLSRASSRSSTVSLASRSAYPGVSEEILERVSQAKTACIAARARYEAALATGNPSVILELEDQLSKTEDELKFARIERTRAKFSSQHITSPSRSPLPPPLPAPPPLQVPLQLFSRPVHKDQAPFLEQGQEPRKLGARTDAKTDLGDEHLRAQVVNKPKPARTERDHIELFSQDPTTSPRPLPPPIPVSPLLQIATRFSSQLRNMPFLEQREDPSNRCHRDDAKTGLEDQRLQIADERNLTTTKHDRAKLAGQSVAISPGLSAPPSMVTPPPLPPEVEEPAPFLEWGEVPRRCVLNQGTGSKMGEEVGIAGGREERTRSVHDGRVQLPGHYEHEGHSRTSFVPLDREQYMYLPNAPRTATGPRTQPLQDQEEREVQHHVPLTVVTHQSRTPQPLAHHQEQPGVNSPPPPINYASRPLRSPPVFATTSTRGSVSWIQPRNSITPVQHIVGGFGGGGDPEGSSYYESSESDHGNGGGGRPPGWWDDDPGDPDHNDEGQSDDRQPRRGRHGKDRDNEPRRGPCGGGPPGGDPPDDGEPEGGKDGNSERSNRKDSKKKRGVTPFSEIPEEGSPHYHYEYFEYKPKPPTSLKKPLKEKVFTRFVTLIEWRLFTKLKVVGDGKAQ